MIKVVRQPFYNAFGKVLLLSLCIEGLFFARIGDEAQFEERRRHVGMQEDVEVGRLDTAVREVRRLHVLLVNVVGQAVIIRRLAVVIGRDTAGRR